MVSVHSDSISKIDQALAKLDGLSKKELNNPQRTIAKMIGHSLSTTQRALKLFYSESEIGSPKNQKPKIPSSSGSNKPHSSDIIIDDPDELLFSVAIRELNKPNPIPQWASVLIQVRKELGKKRSDVMDKLVKLPTKSLVEMLKKGSGKS